MKYWGKGGRMVAIRLVMERISVELLTFPASNWTVVQWYALPSIGHKSPLIQQWGQPLQRSFSYPATVKPDIGGSREDEQEAKRGDSVGGNDWNAQLTAWLEN